MFHPSPASPSLAGAISGVDVVVRGRRPSHEESLASLQEPLEESLEGQGRRADDASRGSRRLKARCAVRSKTLAVEHSRRFFSLSPEHPKKSVVGAKKLSERRVYTRG